MAEDFEDMRPVSVDGDTIRVAGWLSRLAQEQQAVKIFLDVNGEPVSIHDCDWMLIRPCGCVTSIMSAYAAGEIYATEDDAWHEIYDVDPHPHKRVRERDIRRMKAEGWTVCVAKRDESVRLHRMKPDHSHETTKENGS